MKKQAYIFIFLLILMIACKSSNNNSNKEFAIPDSLKKSKQLKIPKKTLEDVVNNVASPLEMAAVMLELDIPYSNDYIASTDSIDYLNTELKQATNLGLYGADLGYLNMYNKTSLILNYIKAIKDLANEINVGQFFDFRTLKRLVSNKSHLDSLILISQQNFNDIDEYLRKNNRGYLSTLIIAGTWTEGMYIATQIMQDQPHEKIREIIGDQKIQVSKISALVNNYKHPYFQSLGKQFNELSRIYSDEVQITTKVGEPKMVEEDGRMIFKQGDKTIIEVPDSTLQKLVNKIEHIRGKITQK